MYRTVTISVLYITQDFSLHISAVIHLWLVSHRTAYCFYMKVHDILQRALGKGVVIRLKPRVCSMGSWAAGGHRCGQAELAGQSGWAILVPSVPGLLPPRVMWADLHNSYQPRCSRRITVKGDTFFDGAKKWPCGKMTWGAFVCFPPRLCWVRVVSAGAQW